LSSDFSPRRMIVVDVHGGVQNVEEYMPSTEGVFRLRK
jgi:hypothetical protein